MDSVPETTCAVAAPLVAAAPTVDIIHTVDTEPAPGRPTVPEVRGHVPSAIRGRSLWHGVAIFAVVAGLYGLTFWGALAAPWWPLQIVSAIFNGMFIGTFFIVGHDACHGSLTPFDSVNRVLGRIAFLPSLAPYIT